MPYFELLQHKSAASSDQLNVTTPAMDTSNATFLAVHRACWFHIPTFSDSYGNTWLSTGSSSNTVNTLFYCFPPPDKVGPGHTFSSTHGIANWPSLSATAWRGGNGNLDAFSLNPRSAAGAGAFIDTGSITPLTDNCLILSSLSRNIGGLPTVGGGPWEIAEFVDWQVNAVQSSALAYILQGATTAVEGQWDWSAGSTDAAASIIAFEAGDPLSSLDTGTSWFGSTRIAGGVQRYQCIPAGLVPPNRAA